MPVHYGYEVQIDNEPEKSTKTTITLRTLLLAHEPLARPGKPGAGMEHDGNHARRSPHDVVLNGVKSRTTPKDSGSRTQV